jgi:hypothetical protein
MTRDQSSVTATYLEHLTARDLELLAGLDSRPAQAEDRQPSCAVLPGDLDDLLSSSQVFESIFASSDDRDPLLAASPFLVFAVAVHRATAQLETMSYVPEWLGLSRRAPVFDVVQLREFMASPWRRLFLTELLASYTHVTSGSVMVPTRRGLRRQRFSDLDPVRLAALLELVSDAERPGVLRRLGDLSLFLTGVFPDYIARRGFGPIDEGRLLRAGIGEGGRTTLRSRQRGIADFGERGAVGLLEQLGRRWYRGAFEMLPRPVAENVAVIGELPERFDQARRMLGFVTEEFVFPHRDRWFGIAGG